MAKRSPLEDGHGAGCFETSRTWPVAVQSKKKPLGAQAQHCCPRTLNGIWTDVGGSSGGDFLWRDLAQFAGVTVNFLFFCVDTAELAGVHAIALAGLAKNSPRICQRKVGNEGKEARALCGWVDCACGSKTRQGVRSQIIDDVPPLIAIAIFGKSRNGGFVVLTTQFLNHKLSCISAPYMIRSPGVNPPVHIYIYMSYSGSGFGFGFDGGFGFDALT
ncbi:hypothetical protein DFH09DRAFT_1098269 [Mycena vulgaris]|nr:hypothetical protein DFH09DRAFT_1098269 [Mycena vulgaris]